MYEILPAILPKSESDLERQLGLVDDIERIHLDIIDPNLTAELHRAFEVHIMLEEPEQAAIEWVERGAERLIVHTLSETVQELRSLTELGLGVELDLDLEEVYERVDEVDFVHFMSIAEIGAQGRPFEPKIFDRIKKFKERYPEVLVSVDGGIDLENASELLNVGAERLIVGSDILATDNPEETYEDFLALIQ